MNSPVERFDFCRGRWGMTQSEVSQHETSACLRATPSELYYGRELAGFQATTKYSFSPKGSLWAGTYRILAASDEEMHVAFDTLRTGNTRFYGEPTSAVRVLADGRTLPVEPSAELRLTAPGSEFEWLWRFANCALCLSIFSLNGRVEVWMMYASPERLEALSASSHLARQSPWIGQDQLQPLRQLSGPFS